MIILCLLFVIICLLLMTYMVILIRFMTPCEVSFLYSVHAFKFSNLSTLYDLLSFKQMMFLLSKTLSLID